MQAGGAYLLATNLMKSLYNYRSLLSNSPPIPGEKTGPVITPKVVIILIDSLRVDTALISWLLLDIFLKTFFRSPMRISLTTLSITVSLIFIVAFPINFNYAIVGPLVSCTSPNMLSMYLAALIQCLFIEIIGSVSAVVSVPIHLVSRSFSGE